MDWFKRVNQIWLSRIKHAEEVKERQFDKNARKLWGYLTRSYTELYCQRDELDEESMFSVEQGPYYKPRLNKCQEYVDLYLPYVLAQTPSRVVNVTRPQFPAEVYDVALPMMGPQGEQIAIPYGMYDAQVRARLQTAATLQQWWLNYTPREYHLMREARLALTEALVKGRGMLMHSMKEFGTSIMPVSFFESVDNLLIDPDTTVLRDAGYIAIKRRQPAWLASEHLGLEESELVGLAKKQKPSPHAPVSDTPDIAEDVNGEIEMVEYWEVYSRIGIGHVLAGDDDDDLGELREALDSVGAHCWLVIAEGADRPLNLHENLILTGSMTEVSEAISWPVRTYGKIANPWPISIIDFKPNADNPWAKSPLEPGLPMQVFLDHIYGYVMSRVRQAARTIILLANDCHDEISSQLKSGSDLAIVRIPREQVNKLAGDLYNVLEIPPVKAEVWQLLQLIDDQFKRAVGLDDGLYGASGKAEPRSAFAAQTRSQAMTGRARAMADQVDEWMGQVAFKELLLTRQHVSGEQVAVHFNERELQEQGAPGPLTMIWDAHVNTTDEYQAAEEYSAEVVSGSGRRKDKAAQGDAVMQLGQVVLPAAMKIGAETGDYSQYNEFLRRMSEAMDQDLSAFRISLPPAPPPGPEGPPGAPPPEETGGAPPPPEVPQGAPA